MARRATAPVVTQESPVSARVKLAKRATLLQELKALEWDFDRKPRQERHDGHRKDD